MGTFQLTDLNADRHVLIGLDKYVNSSFWFTIVRFFLLAPSRQSQDRTLDPLPVELYTHILNHFAPRNFDYPVTRGEHKELVNIALVCRCFCATVLPWIFHTLSWPYDGNAMTTLCQGLVQNAPAAEALALFVKKASVLQKPMESSLATDAFIRLHLNGVCRMKELRSLTLSHIAPKKRLCRILEELPNLSTLELLYCISNDNGAPMKEPIALPPSLTTLRMLGTRWPSLVDSVDLQVLRELTTNHEDLLSRIQKVETLPMESFLWCGSSHLMTPSLLDRMPNLKKLCYNYDWQETGTVCNLDFGRVVPLLEEACLPLDFVWRFNISERRLAKLSIAPSRRLAPHQIETLDVCSSRMKSLCIPHGCYTAWECASNFPNLQSLEITNVTAPTPGFSNFGISLFTPYILDEVCHMSVNSATHI